MKRSIESTPDLKGMARPMVVERSMLREAVRYHRRSAQSRLGQHRATPLATAKALVQPRTVKKLTTTGAYPKRLLREDYHSMTRDDACGRYIGDPKKLESEPGSGG